MTDLEQVTKNGFYIRNIENPSEEVQLAAVKHNPMAIKFIKSPTEKVCFEAVSHNGKSLEYVKNQTMELCMAALEDDIKAIYYVNEEFLTEEFYRYALEKDVSPQRVVYESMPDEIYRKILNEMQEKDGVSSGTYRKISNERQMLTKIRTLGRNFNDEKTLNEMPEEEGRENDWKKVERFVEETEFEGSNKKFREIYRKNHETAVAMLGSVIENVVIDGEVYDSNIFYASTPAWKRAYLIGVEASESKVDARVIGVGRTHTFEPALFLCPNDKAFSRQEIMDRLRITPSGCYNVYIDPTIH